jgi:hypothetical protein
MNTQTDPYPPLLPYTPTGRPMANHAEVRRYAKFVARQWQMPTTRIGKKFLADCEEKCRRAVSELVVANAQRRRKTLK